MITKIRITTTHSGGDKIEDRTAHNHLRDTLLKVNLNRKGRQSIPFADNLSRTFVTGLEPLWTNERGIRRRVRCITALRCAAGSARRSTWGTALGFADSVELHCPFHFLPEEIEQPVELEGIRAI